MKLKINKGRILLRPFFIVMEELQLLFYRVIERQGIIQPITVPVSARQIVELVVVKKGIIYLFKILELLDVHIADADSLA